MASKKPTLPEYIIDDPESVLSKQAKGAHEHREKVNEHTAKEGEFKKRIAENSEGLRDNLADEEPPNIVGKITITPPNQTATRVEFRINNGSLDADELDNLDKLFGPCRPEIFERAVVVDQIVDPTELIESLKKAGLNPWDYLTLNVRPDVDQIVIANGKGITTAEAILPREGFLAKVKDLISQFSEEAKTYIRLYLKQALKPTVILGTKAKT